MVVLGYDHSFFDAVPEKIGSRYCHLPCRFARCNEQYAPGELTPFEGAADRGVRLHGPDRTFDYLIRMGTQ